jgi:nucleoid DNA-binding protein
MLSGLVARRLGIPRRHADAIIVRTFSVIVDTLSEGRTVKLKHFGKFETRTRKGWQGRHPTSGRRVAVRERRFIAFAPGKQLKERVASRPYRTR